MPLNLSLSSFSSIFLPVHQARERVRERSKRKIILQAAAAFSLLLSPFSSASPARAHSDLTFRLTDQKSAPVGDAVVSLIALDRPASSADAPQPTAPPATVEIEQKGQEFLPFVSAIRVGTTVQFPNRDTIAHHVYSESPTQKFELPLYRPGKAEMITFEKPGLVTIGCNIHDWMIAYIVVLDTPHFVVTTADGSAGLKAVAPGRYRAEIWHPRLRAPLTQEVSVTDEAQTFNITLALRPDRRIRRTIDPATGSYR